MSRSVLYRFGARRWRRAAVVTAVAAGTAAAIVVGGNVTAAPGSRQASALVSGTHATARPAGPVLVPAPSSAAMPKATPQAWDWRAHRGMGPTRVSGPVTHPGVDHAGGGLERLGHHRSIAMSPAAQAAPVGLDVSAYQPNVSWTAASARGARFAYMKATEGTGYVSPNFGSQYSGSYRAGLIRGSYHFALPDRSSGATQADYFISNGGGWSADGQTLPGALDIEYNPYGAECYGLSQGGMRAWVSSFLAEYRARTARWPVIYSTTDWWTTCTGNYGGFATQAPLWIACYCGSAAKLPAGWSTYTIWQNADSGPFPGDQDVFNGNIDGLQRLAAGAGSNPAVAGTAGAAGTVRVYVRGTARSAYENVLKPNGTWSGFAKLGGVWPANVAALATSTGGVDLFAVGTGGHLTADTLTGSTWSGWKDLGAPSGGLQGVPTAVQDHAGTVRVYVRSANQHLYEIRLPKGGRWSAFANMGGILPGDLKATVVANGYVWIFAVGSNSALYARDLPPGGSWSGWINLGGSTIGVPAVTQDQAGTIRVYVRGANQHLYEIRLTKGGRWSGFANMGGSLPADAAATVVANGYVWVFVVGSNGALFARDLPPGGSWSGWTGLGGGVSGVPAVAQDQGGTIRVYARGSNGHLSEFRLPKGGRWSAASNMGGGLF